MINIDARQVANTPSRDVPMFDMRNTQKSWISAPGQPCMVTKTALKFDLPIQTPN